MRSCSPRGRWIPEPGRAACVRNGRGRPGMSPGWTAAWACPPAPVGWVPGTRSRLMAGSALADSWLVWMRGCHPAILPDICQPFEEVAPDHACAVHGPPLQDEPRRRLPPSRRTQAGCGGAPSFRPLQATGRNGDQASVGKVGRRGRPTAEREGRRQPRRRQEGFAQRRRLHVGLDWEELRAAPGRHTAGKWRVAGRGRASPVRSV